MTDLYRKGSLIAVKASPDLFIDEENLGNVYVYNEDRITASGRILSGGGAYIPYKTNGLLVLDYKRVGNESIYYKVLWRERNYWIPSRRVRLTKPGTVE